MFLGIDIGTQSLKALLIDESLRPVGEGTARYETSFPRPGWAEQDPRDWLKAIGPAIAAALDAAGLSRHAVTAIGISGQLDGCIATDSSGAPIGNAIIWMDRRADGTLDHVDGRLVREQCGLVKDGTHMAAKIAWLCRHDPAAAAAVTWHQPVSLLVAALTGNRVMDRALASTTMLSSLADAGWNGDLCQAFGVDPLALPAISSAGAVAGTLNEAGAALTGLRRGCVVAVGTGDDFANPIGSGISAPGIVGVTLGTGEVVTTLSDDPVIDASLLLETRCFPTGHYQLGNPGWMSGGALRWFRSVFGVADDGAIDELAAVAPPGSEGVLFFPGLSGAMSPRWNASGRASFYGMTGAHDRGHLARALLEGNAFAMRDVIAQLQAMDVATDSIRLVGGGARSALWAQMRADVSGLPVDALADVDASALGAGLLAAVAAGAYGSISEATDALPLDVERYEPRISLKPVYDDAYGRYRLLFDRLEPAFMPLLPGAQV